VHYGRLVREKGVMTLLEAMRMVPDLHLYVAGTGDAEAEMKQYIQQHNLENVTMLGYLASEELIPLVQKAAFSIVPSEWYENYSMSVIESLACGTPVIGSRIGGIPEQIIDGTNGLLFEMGRSDSLAEKIRYMIQNPEELARMSRSTRQLVETVNDPENHYQETMQIYESVMR
jgi:glycosyltransferase involved in cell wall biosynthesis